MSDNNSVSQHTNYGEYNHLYLCNVKHRSNLIRIYARVRNPKYEENNLLFSG